MALSLREVAFTVVLCGAIEALLGRAYDTRAGSLIGGLESLGWPLGHHCVNN
jgi:hypothetical protein